MTPDLEAEFTDLFEKANALGLAAEAHDKVCQPSCGQENHECYENRVFIVALVADRLGLTLSDLGFIAEKIVDLQGESGCRPCGDETPMDWPDTITGQGH